MREQELRDDAVGGRRADGRAEHVEALLAVRLTFCFVVVCCVLCVGEVR